MAIKPIKIKNSSQSGKKNIADELNEVIETQLPTVEETKAELQPVVTKAVTESLKDKLKGALKESIEEAQSLEDDSLHHAFEDEIAANSEFAQNKAHDFACLVNDEYDEVRSPSDAPILIVAGKRVALTELPGGKHPFIAHDRYHGTDELIVTRNDPRNNCGLYSKSQIKSTNVVKWYTATVSGIEFNLSSGSSVTIKQEIDGYGYHDYSYEPIQQAIPKRVLIVLASKVECNYLSVDGKCVLNNSALIADQYLRLAGCIVVCSNMNSDYNIDVKHSRVSQTSVYNASYVNISEKSHIESGYISGIGRITLTDVRCNDGFRLAGHTRGNGLKAALEVKGHSLSRFDSYFGDMEKVIKLYQDDEHRYTDLVMIIERRIDYGVFSGITDMPFIRVGAHSMLIGSELFTAEEFFGTASQDTQPKAVDPTVYRSEETTFRPNFGMGVLGSGSFYKGSLVWNRAAKVLYGHKHRTLVVGKSAESMVNSLVEQIKSRIGLYVEISNMGL